MKKIIVVIFLVALLAGCVTWRDSYGNRASRADEFDCDHKCGNYDMKQNPFAYAFCKRDCMQSKGYSTK
jgi:hypothetical protein